MDCPPIRQCRVAHVSEAMFWSEVALGRSLEYPGVDLCCCNPMTLFAMLPLPFVAAFLLAVVLSAARRTCSYAIRPTAFAKIDH
jgi:hypothetical protein